MECASTFGQWEAPLCQGWRSCKEGGSWVGTQSWERPSTVSTKTQALTSQEGHTVWEGLLPSPRREGRQQAAQEEPGEEAPSGSLRQPQLFTTTQTGQALPAIAC